MTTVPTAVVPLVGAENVTVGVDVYPLPGVVIVTGPTDKLAVPTVVVPPAGGALNVTPWSAERL